MYLQNATLTYNIAPHEGVEGGIEKLTHNIAPHCGVEGWFETLTYNIAPHGGYEGGFETGRSVLTHGQFLYFGMTSCQDGLQAEITTFLYNNVYIYLYMYCFMCQVLTMSAVVMSCEGSSIILQ